MGPEDLKCSSISLSGNLHPQNSRMIPSLQSGDRTSQYREVKGRALDSQNPEPQQ
jgi:hypothetical protein